MKEADINKIRLLSEEKCNKYACHECLKKAKYSLSAYHQCESDEITEIALCEECARKLGCELPVDEVEKSTNEWNETDDLELLDSLINEFCDIDGVHETIRKLRLLGVPDDILVGRFNFDEEDVLGLDDEVGHPEDFNDKDED